MDKLEKQLFNLPKFKMSYRMDYKIKMSIFILNFQRVLRGSLSNFRFARFAFQSLAVVFILAVMVALPAYSYASSNVTAENPLYFLKRGVEKIELSLTPVAAQPELYIKLADRRLAEAEILAKRQPDEKTIVLRVRAVQEAQDQVQKADNKTDLSSAAGMPDNIEIQKKDIKARENDEIKKIADDVTIEMKQETIDNVATLLDKQVMPVAETETPSVSSPDPAVSSDDQPNNNISASSTKEESSHSSDLGRNKRIEPDKKPAISKIERQKKSVISKSKLINSASSSAVILDRLNTLRTNYNILNATNTEDSKSKDKTNGLMGILKKKITDAEKKFKAGQINEARGIIDSSETLQNFTKHLLQYKNNEKSTGADDKNGNKSKSVENANTKVSNPSASSTPSQLKSNQQNERNMRNKIYDKNK
jgi:hypothetical protein